jgi:NADH dehydrogenase
VKTEHHLERLRLADGEFGRRHGALKIKIKEHGADEIGAGLVVWSTGLMANPLISKLAAKQIPLPGANPPSTQATRHLLRDSRTGGILTDAHLRALVSTSTNPAEEQQQQQHQAPLEDVYVIGDCAVLQNEPTLPKTAQVAAQQATHLAKRLNARDVAGKAFRFRNWGTLTYLGSWKAIHQSQADELKGWVAWVVWRGAYLTKSMSWRNKLLVPVYWVVSWVFGRGISRFYGGAVAEG